MRPHPPPPRLRVPTGLVLLALAVSVFSLLAIDLLWHGPVTAADAAISNWFHLHRHPLLTPLLLVHQPRLRRRVAGTFVAVAMAAFTALSRVYPGAHYPSDVLAAIAEGVAWLALCFTVPALWVPNQPVRSAADG